MAGRASIERIGSRAVTGLEVATETSTIAVAIAAAVAAAAMTVIPTVTAPMESVNAMKIERRCLAAKRYEPTSTDISLLRAVAPHSFAPSTARTPCRRASGPRRNLFQKLWEVTNLKGPCQRRMIQAGGRWTGRLAPACRFSLHGD